MAAATTALGFASGGATVVAAETDPVRINHLQVVGSHNSYHLIPSSAETELRRTFIGDGEDLLTYAHSPLPTQFSDQGVRQIELDLFVDTAGGRYVNPLLRSATGLGPLDPVMNDPGIKVLHVQDVDYATTCLTLLTCLGQVEAWSDANPSHVPIAILLELKDSPLEVGGIEFTMPEPWTAGRLDDLDAEIRSVFDPSDMITPDDVRGGRATLEEAVLADEWPTLDESRGKVMFLMDNSGTPRSDYRAGRPSLEGRVLFTNSNPGSPDAAFVKRNDPTDESAIAGLVEAGYVVRTRADVETVQARNNDTSMRDAALRSGAQWVSTDYPAPGLAVGFTTDYVVEIPGVARCNPISAPASCVSGDLEDLSDPTPVPSTVPEPTEPMPPTSAVPSPSSTPTAPPSSSPPGASPRPPSAPPARPRPGVPTYAG